MPRDTDPAEGNAMKPAIEKLFSNPEIAYIHPHYAKPGAVNYFPTG
jgi:hypothetical protein